MAKKERVFTAPLAVIQINSVTVGKMKNVRITENIRRGRVSGLGRLNPEELPALEWTGSLSCSSYTINFNLLANKLKKGTFRNAGTIEEWANAILMQEDGLEIAILKKVKDGEIDLETGLVKTKYETFAKVSGAFATREGFDVQEGQISGRDTEFEYTDPILYNDIA
jgi:hypothetical protein|nr:MAG TPA: hypothetical protein [Caudoviricetes sp.]